MQDSPVRTTFVDSHSVCMCFEHGGDVRLYDLRCPDDVLTICKKGYYLTVFQFKLHKILLSQKIPETGKIDILLLFKYISVGSTRQ